MTLSTRNVVTAFGLCIALVVGFSLPSLASDREDLEQHKTYLGHQIDGAKTSYDEASKEFAEAAEKLRISKLVLAEAEAHLGETRGELMAARARDAQLQADLAKAEDDLAEAEDELRKGQEAHEAAEDEVRAFTVQMMQDGDPGLRAFSDLLRGEDPGMFAQQISINTALADAHLARMQELEAADVMLSVARNQVEQLRDTIKADKAAAAANVVHMESLEAEAASREAGVSRLVGINRVNAANAEAVKYAEAAKVRELEAERARTEQMIRNLTAPGSGNFGGDGGPLSYPIPGAPVTSPYGMRVHPITGVYKLHDGTDFGAACGTRIGASAAGTVIDAYYNSAYGNRVLIAHSMINGKSVVTTYNHLSRFAVSKGQVVARGQTVGYVGTTGYSTGCHLHFMVIANGVTTDPMGWL